MPTLSDKITTIEDYRATVHTTPMHGTVRVAEYIANKGTENEYFQTPTGVLFGLNGQAPYIGQIMQVERWPKTHWWVHREQMRMYLQVYPVDGRVLSLLRGHAQLSQYLFHQSKEEPGMIAFTASLEDGLKDRQTRTTLGRFLRKYMPLATDKAIAAVEAAWRAELNPPIEFISAMDEPDRFEAAYCRINSCMSKSRRNYPHANEVGWHPVNGYGTPGFKLAVLKTAEGADDSHITSRALVWENPEDANDKRWVRAYGDIPVMTAVLKKLGYVNIPFEGAYLKTIDAGIRDGHRHGLIVPYVDQGDGSGKLGTNAFGIWDGEEKIYLFGSQTKVRVEDKYRVSIFASGGVSYACPFPMNKTCALSGVKIDLFNDEFTTVKLDGKTVTVLVSALTTAGWFRAMDMSVSSSGAVWVKPGTPTFLEGRTIVVDDQYNRKRFNYFQLSENFYPNDREWKKLSNNSEYVVVMDMVTEVANAMIRRDDAVFYINEGTDGHNVHISQLPKSAVRILEHKGFRTYMHKDTPHVTNIHGRACVRGIHDIVQLHDGGWELRKNAKAVKFLGVDMWILNDQTLTDVQINDLPPAAKQRMSIAMNTVSQKSNVFKKALFAVFARTGDFLVPTEEAAGGGLSAGYVFEYRDIPLKLVTKWLEADYTPVENMEAAQSQLLHKFGRIVIREAAIYWEAKAAQPKVAEEAAATAT